MNAASPMPSGSAVWRIPIAVPRRWGGNQPTTSRPLAELVLAAPIPASSQKAPRATYDVLRAAPSPPTVTIARPIVSDRRSPIRSTTAPQATSESVVATSGVEARRPACTRVSPRSRCRYGMRKMGALDSSVPAICASIPTASIVHRFGDCVEWPRSAREGAGGGERLLEQGAAAALEVVQDLGLAASSGVSQVSSSASWRGLHSPVTGTM